MTTETILDSMYLVPAILDHLHNPTDETQQIIDKYAISETQLQYLTSIRHLLMYHQDIVQNRFEKSNYPLLRKGLTEYFDVYLNPVFKLLGITNQKANVLDYGCGEGQISRQFRYDNPESTVMMIDKVRSNDNVTEVDFEQNPNWYVGLESQFDYVILSEILHCKDKIGQQYLINSSVQLLKLSGSIIISENEDACMEYRIGKLKGVYYPVSVVTILDMISKWGFEIVNHIKIQNHHTWVCSKVLTRCS